MRASTIQILCVLLGILWHFVDPHGDKSSIWIAASFVIYALKDHA